MLKTVPKKIALGLLVIILILQSFLLIKLTKDINLLKSEQNKLTTDIQIQSENIEAQNRSLLGEINNQRLIQKPVIMPKENLVVFPELKIALPYNSITKTFEYTYGIEEVGTGVESIRVTSNLISLESQPESSNLSCAELARISLKDVGPYSPWEEKGGSTTLDDGRSVYIVTAKAFKNKEASTEACASDVWTEITPKQVAEEFKKGQAF